MPKNKSGGRNNRKRASKHAQPIIRMNVRLAKDDAEMYAIVTKLCGNGRADVKCSDGVTRLLEIRKKFRGRNKRDNMIAMGTIILVGERDWEVRSAKKKEKVGTEVVGNIIHCKTYKSRLTKENQMVDVRLSYTKGLDRYYGLLELAVEAGIFNSVSTRIELPDGSKTFGKTINNDPEKYYTEEVMEKLDTFAKEKFCYG